MKVRRGWGLVLVVLVMAGLVALAAACGGGEATATPAAEPAQGGPASGSTLAPEGATAIPAPAAVMTLTLPDGATMALPIFKCDGTAAGQFLDLRAANSRDQADAQRIEVQVSGNHQGAGRYEAMYVSVVMGAETALKFNGNNPAAEVTLGSNGAGQFVGVSIINTASNSPAYQYNTEYPFGGEWNCGQ